MAGSVAGSSRDGGIPARDAATVSTPAPELLRHSLPWVLVLFITAGFHFYRGVPADGWIFLAAGLALGADTALRHVRHRGSAGPSRPAAAQSRQARLSGRVLVWALPALGAGAAVVVVLAPPDSLGVPAAVGLAGAGMLVVAWPQRPSPAQLPGVEPSRPRTGRASQRPGDSSRPRAPKPLRRSAWWWASVLLFLALWELGNYFIDVLDPAGAWAYPPLTDLLQPLFDNQDSRWLMMLVWLAGCAGLVRSAVKP